MKKQAVLVWSMCLIMGVAGITQAKNTREPALAEIEPLGCNETEVGLFDTSLFASWGWSGGNTQTKFGGDAVYTVEASVNGGLSELVAVEIPIVQYVLDTPAEDYAGMFAYSCTDQTMESGTCDGAVLGLEDALWEAVLTELNLLEGDTLEILSTTLEGVYVKAMNPSVEGETLDGKKIKRQNFPLVNVCEVVEEP